VKCEQPINKNISTAYEVCHKPRVDKKQAIDNMPGTMTEDANSQADELQIIWYALRISLLPERFISNHQSTPSSSLYTDSAFHWSTSVHPNNRFF